MADDNSYTPTKRGRGRPKKLDKDPSRDQLVKALELAATGISIRKICREIGIKPVMFNEFRKRAPNFDAAFQNCRETGIEVLADDLLDIAEDFVDPLMARVHSDNVRWYLSKKKPKQYGDSLNINIDQKISVTDALQEARKRAGILDVTPKAQLGSASDSDTDNEWDLSKVVASVEDDDIFS